jgi:hypothetical protein
MPSSLKTYADFDALLANTRLEVVAMAVTEPYDDVIRSVRRQLDALFDWTRDGRCPTAREKDQLNFGVIASHTLDMYPVAGSLNALASFLMYWEA